MINIALRWILNLQYDHIRAGIDAMRMDAQGSARLSYQQQADIAKQETKALNVLRRLSALEIAR